MQSGRILPVFRQFFAPATKTGQSNRDANPQGGQGQQRERDATEEEAQRAAELLADSDEFKKNALTVKVSSDRGLAVLLVLDRSGHTLRMIQSHEVTRILLSFSHATAPGQGRILDRRI